MRLWGLSVQYKSIAVLGMCITLMYAVVESDDARAAEGGVGVYLLGVRGPMTGFTPPSGVYFQDDTYFYDGKIGGGRSFPNGGLLVANVSASTWMNLPTTIWVTPAKIFGGDLAFSADIWRTARKGRPAGEFAAPGADRGECHRRTG